MENVWPLEQNLRQQHLCCSLVLDLRFTDHRQADNEIELKASSASSCREWWTFVRTSLDGQKTWLLTRQGGCNERCWAWAAKCQTAGISHQTMLVWWEVVRRFVILRTCVSLTTKNVNFSAVEMSRWSRNERDKTWNNILLVNWIFPCSVVSNSIA